MQISDIEHRQLENQTFPSFPPFVFFDDAVKLRELAGADDTIPKEDRKKQFRKILKTARQRSRRLNALLRHPEVEGK